MTTPAIRACAAGGADFLEGVLIDRVERALGANWCTLPATAVHIARAGLWYHDPIDLLGRDFIVLVVVGIDRISHRARAEGEANSASN